jgi:Ca-activated chloride channel family protein
MLLWPRLDLREPWFLALALLALPAWLWARRSGGRVVFSSLSLLPKRPRSLRSRLAFLPDALLSLAVVALAVALAGPRVGDRAARIRREGIAIMMAADISGSMQALDLSTPGHERSRLDAVKDVFREFVLGGPGLAGRPDDAIGLVSFARYADCRSPLTLDHTSLAAVASELRPANRDEDGTALGDGLGLSVLRLGESKARSRIVILLTDGVSNSGDMAPLEAADLAKSQGIRVYTVGAGTNGVAPIRVEDPFTGQSVLRQMPVEIDEDTLQKIAERTGGRYFRATDGDALAAVYREIDRLERSEVSEERFQQYREYFDVFAAAGLVSVALAFLLRGSWLRRLP